MISPPVQLSDGPDRSATMEACSRVLCTKRQSGIPNVDSPQPYRDPYREIAGDLIGRILWISRMHMACPHCSILCHAWTLCDLISSCRAYRCYLKTVELHQASLYIDGKSSQERFVRRLLLRASYAAGLHAIVARASQGVLLCSSFLSKPICRTDGRFVQRLQWPQQE